MSIRKENPIVTQHGFTLRFADGELESDYLEQEFRRSERWVPKALIFAALLVVCFLPIDSILVPDAAAQITQRIRAYVIAPVPLLGFVAFQVMRNPVLRARLLEFGTLIVGLMWSVVVLVGGSETVPYHTFALIQTQVGTFVLLALPYRRALRVAGIFSLVFVACVAYLKTPFGSALLAYAGVPAFLLIVAFGQYRYESASRQRFLAERQVVAEYERRVVAESERRRWLETIAGFLRHELRNSLAGVSTSLELTRRVTPDPRGQEYLVRADRSLQFMRRMLQQVAEATSIEAALKTQKKELVDIVALIRERISDLQVGDWQCVELMQVERSMPVWCDSDSIVQMLDKLVSNAVEHASTGSNVSVALRSDRDYASIEISNRGDPLPHDTEALFLPFVTGKAATSDGNLGLGLYVARVIAVHHGGDIEARPLSDPPGALFVVRLPLASTFETPQAATQR